MGRYFTSIKALAKNSKTPSLISLFTTPSFQPPVFSITLLFSRYKESNPALCLKYNLHDLMPTLSLVFLERLMSPVHWGAGQTRPHPLSPPARPRSTDILPLPKISGRLYGKSILFPKSNGCVALILTCFLRGKYSLGLNGFLRKS